MKNYKKECSLNHTSEKIENNGPFKLRRLDCRYMYFYTYI